MILRSKHGETRQKETVRFSEKCFEITEIEVMARVECTERWACTYKPLSRECFDWASSCGNSSVVI